MPPRSESHKLLQRRLRRTMNYGQLRMDNLTLPLSHMVVQYFNRYNSYDYLDVDFASKLAREGCVDPTTLIVAMVYIDRVRRASPSFFTETSPEDVYLSSLVIAAKFLQDSDIAEYIWNDEWAQCSSRSVQRVNELELEILSALDWNLQLTTSEFRNAVESVETWIAMNSLKRNKFLTYNDFAILVRKWDSYWDEVKALFKFTSAISLTYLGTLCLTIMFTGMTVPSVDSPTTTATNVSITTSTPVNSETSLAAENFYIASPVIEATVASSEKSGSAINDTLGPCAGDGISACLSSFFITTSPSGLHRRYPYETASDCSMRVLMA